MKQLSLILTMCVASAWGQVLPYQPFALIKSYLQLSDSQYRTVVSNNDQFYEWYGVKQRRMAEVRIEIAQEAAKDTIDPMALGIRYTEVELICRDISQRTVATQKMNIDVLTDSQKVKLKTLEDAIKLAPVISDAQNARLLAGSSFVGGYSGIITGTFGFPSSLNGCSSQIVPTLVVPNPFQPVGATETTAPPAGR